MRRSDITLIRSCLDVTQDHVLFSTQPLFTGENKKSAHVFLGISSKESRHPHVSSSFFWTARYERLPFVSLINLRRPWNRVVEKDDVCILTRHTAARRKLIAFVRAWGSGASASISFWERDYNSREMRTEKEEEGRKHTFPA